MRVGDTVRIISTDERLGEVERLQGQLATFLSRRGRRCAVALVEDDPRSIACRSNGMMHFDIAELELAPRTLRDATPEEIADEPTAVLRGMLEGDCGVVSDTTLQLARDEVARRQPVVA